MTKRYLTAGVLLLLGFFWGCGTSEYERRLDARIIELKTGSKFNILSSPTEVPGTSVSIRIPKKSEANKSIFARFTNGFDNPPLTEGAMVDGKAVDPRRVKLNVINLTDLKITYEGFIEDGNKGKQSYYLYIAVSSGANRVNYPKLLQSELISKFDDTTELTDYQAPTPEGRSIDWKQCRGTGNQDFYYILPSGEGQFRKMPGTIELLFYDDKIDTLVTLALRMPTRIEKNIDFTSWKNMVAGCVKVKP